MKLSLAASLVAAPLALAGLALPVDLLRRDVDLVERSNGGSKGYSSDYGKGGNKNSGDVVVEEVLVIWVNNGGGSPTTTLAAAAAVSTGTSTPITHQVVVGGPAGLVYTPNSINAAIGDMVVFTFLSANHTATQSAFAAPCVKITGGMDSGFMPNPNNSVVPPPQMAMQVSVSTPIWFYCRQKTPASHCGKGMTFSINPTVNKTQAMFEQMAIAQNGTGATAAIVGGTGISVASTPAATAAAPPTSSPSIGSSSGSISTGTGNTGTDGSCSCSCLCGIAAFPDPIQQAIGNFGGLSGSIALASLPQK